MRNTIEMKSRSKYYSLWILFFSLLTIPVLKAQVPALINYQAQLTDPASGDPIADAEYEIVFTIYDTPSGGTPLWTETQNVQTVNGIYNVLLGSITSIDADLFEGGDRYLGITVESDPEMTPRSQITSVPYSLISEEARFLNGMESSEFAEESHEHANYFTSGGEAGGSIRVLGNTDNYGLGLITNNDTNLYIANDGNITVNGNISNLSDPVNNQDASTKAYVDSLENMILNLLLDGGLNGVVRDIEGTLYRTIKIGNQTWMAENLRTSTYNNGTTIPKVINNAEWSNLDYGAYCWHNNDSVYYEIPFGKLYNGYAVNTGNLCPSGWHISSYNEITELIDYLGGESEAGGKLKEAGSTHWLSGNTGTNETGFTALPGGLREYSGVFYPTVGEVGIWWLTTELSPLNFGYLQLDYYLNNAILLGTFGHAKYGFSIRCIKD